MKPQPPRLPRVAGLSPRQAHVDIPTDAYEREFGSQGFYGPATHFIHKHPPTSFLDFEGPLRPRAFDLGALHGGAVQGNAVQDNTVQGNVPKGSHSPWDAAPVLHNAHLELRWFRFEGGAMDHLVSNGDGEELLFVHTGTCELFCDFGHLSLRDGDYVVLPRSTMWRLTSTEPVVMLLLQATASTFGLPDRGLLGQHALFDPALLDVPAIDEAFIAQQTETRTRVVVKRRAQLTTITYPHNPLDALGWQGDLVPMRINVRDIRPVVSPRYHLPPSAHTTFVSERFVVCTFCPRPLESDPRALKLPFFHSNNDYDEVLFYHQGQFMSRDDIRAGMLSLHPAGFPHGPHPKALRAAEQGTRKHTDEVAVMIDALDPLDVAGGLSAVELTGYARSWQMEPSR